MTSPRRTLGDVIREKRIGSRLSLRELATLTNVSNAYLSQIERDLHQPSIRVLRAIADALELSSEQMMMYAGLVSEDSPVGAPPGPGHTDTERAISADSLLSAEDRETLLALYRRLAKRPAR